MNTLRQIVIATALAAATLISPVHAQYTNPYTGTNWNNPISSYLDTVIVNNMQMQQLMTTQMIQRNMLMMSLQAGRSGKSGKTGKKLTAKEKREQAEAARFAKYQGTMFKDSGKPIMPARLAASLVKQPGKDRQQMTKLLTALLDIYKQRSKQQNAPANDLARTLAYAITVNHAYHREKYITQQEMGALRGKIRAALNNDAKFRKLSNTQKQEMSEALIILTHLAVVGYDEIAKDKITKQVFRKMAGANLQAILGVAPERVSFNKGGLVVSTSTPG